MSERVVVIEDEEAIRENILELLEAEGFEARGARSGEEGIELIASQGPDLVLCDVMLPEMDGFAVLEAVRRHPAVGAVPFVFLTARADRSDMRRGMSLGADDYLTKPFSLSELLEVVRARLERARSLSRAPAVAAPPARPPSPSTPSHRGDAVTPSHRGDAVVVEPSMIALYEQIKRVASTNLSVLLLGETGVGKEVITQAIHRASPRSQGPLVALNCAAFSEQLLESELFGHEKGAFTGAAAAKEGLFESASGGTVLLDEVGEMPLSIQARLLRVLEERKVTRVGGLKPRPIDVRFIAATNCDLEDEVERGAFRQDLYFRLHGVSLHIPPLRERPGEVVPLAERFAAGAARELGLGRPPALAPETLALLLRHRWPGNIRELKNTIERAVVLSGGPLLLPAHLPARLVTAASAVEPAPVGDGKDRLKREMASVERQHIVEALERAGGNQTLAAELLGISRRTLVARLSEYDLPRPRKKAPPKPTSP